MGNIEPRPTDIYEQVRGVHADIVFDTPDAIDIYLGTVHAHATLYRAVDGALKYPIDEARLEYFRDDSGDINLSADIVFDAAASNERSKAAWQYEIRSDMLNFLKDKKAETHELRHQAYDFYIVLNDTFAIFVQFNAETHTCCVDLSLVKLHELYYALNGEGHDAPDDIIDEPDHYDVLKSFASVWSLVIDTTVDRFGKETLSGDKKPQIVIAAPADFDIDQEEYELFHTGGEQTFTAGVTMPESEIDVSDTYGFSFIGGLSHAKERLEDIKATFRDPDGAAMYGISGRHFILHGPAGTGKTSLVHALAKEIKAEIQVVDSSALVDMWVGNSAKNTRALFEAMKTVEGPLIVFFDEFDSLAKKGSLGTSERTDIKKYLNGAIDDISKNHPNIIIAAATNADIDDLEESLMRSGRLEPIGAPAPNEEERVDVWSAVIHKSFLDFSAANELGFTSDGVEVSSAFVPYENDIDPIALAHETDGMTGADFEVILERARRRCYRIYRSSGEVTKVSQADLLREIHQFGH